MDQVLLVSSKQGLGCLFFKVFYLLFWCWARSLCKIMHWNKIYYLDSWCWVCFDQICIIIASRCLGSLRKLWVQGVALEMLMGLFSTRLQSRPQWLFYRMAWFRSLEHQHGSHVSYSNMCRVIWFVVLFGLWRSASWITIPILRLLHCRNRVRQFTVNKLANCWAELIVINNVVLVLLVIVHWDHDIVVVTLYQYWSLKVLFCVGTGFIWSGNYFTLWTCYLFWL